MRLPVCLIRLSVFPATFIEIRRHRLLNYLRLDLRTARLVARSPFSKRHIFIRQPAGLPSFEKA